MLTILGNPVDLPGDVLYITHKYGGSDTLDFSLSPEHEAYHYILEETPVIYGGNRYIIKSINERRDISTVHCELDLDELREQAYYHFASETMTLSQVLDMCIPAGWTVSGADLVTARRTIELDACTGYDVIMQAMETYGVCYRWNTIDRTVAVIKPENIQTSGVYLTEELNLKELAMKGSSKDFITRLYPYGKIDDETGLPLSIASVNGGKEYVENTDYSEKLVSAVWADERYTDPQSLKDDALERLKMQAAPVRSYECAVVDIAKAGAPYGQMSIALYDVVTLLDKRRKTRVAHRVVEYKEYPMRPDLNMVTLSSVSAKITGAIEKIEIQVSNDIAVERGKINTIRRDLDANIARVAETYTKGETDAVIESQITQAKNAIRMEVSETYATKQETDELREDVQRQIVEESSRIEATKDEILAEVSETYTTGSQVDEKVSMSAQLLSDGFTLRFDQIQAATDENSANAADAREKFESLYQYMRYGNGTLELGESGSPIRLQQTNDRIQFVMSDGSVQSFWTPTAWELINLLRFRLGPGALAVQPNGSISGIKAVD
nr:MAG TPA: tail protein [Caudoviricetes sp.]